MRGRINGGSGDVESTRGGSTTSVSTHRPAPAWHVHYMRSRTLSNRPPKPIQHSTFVPKTCFAQSEISMARDLCRSTRYSPHPHSDSFSTAPAPLLLQAACKQLCGKPSFHLPTGSKLPDNVNSNTCIQPCTDTVERTCFAFCGSRRVSWLVGKKLDWWPPLRTTLSLTCCKSKKCATCARRKCGRPSSASLCRPCRSKSPAWKTRCSKRPLSLPDTGSPSAMMASCSSPLPDNSYWIFLPSRR